MIQDLAKIVSLRGYRCRMGRAWLPLAVVKGVHDLCSILLFLFIVLLADNSRYRSKYIGTYESKQFNTHQYTFKYTHMTR